MVRQRIAFGGITSSRYHRPTVSRAKKLTGAFVESSDLTGNRHQTHCSGCIGRWRGFRMVEPQCPLSGCRVKRKSRLCRPTSESDRDPDMQRRPNRQRFRPPRRSLPCCLLPAGDAGVLISRLSRGAMKCERWVYSYWQPRCWPAAQVNRNIPISKGPALQNTTRIMTRRR